MSEVIEEVENMFENMLEQEKRENVLPDRVSTTVIRGGQEMRLNLQMEETGLMTRLLGGKWRVEIYSYMIGDYDAYDVNYKHFRAFDDALAYFEKIRKTYDMD